jgi:hypothetical protein
MRSSLPVPALLATLLTAAVAWVSTSTAKAVTRPPLGVGLGVAHVRRCGTVLGAGWPDPRQFLGEPPRTRRLVAIPQIAVWQKLVSSTQLQHLCCMRRVLRVSFAVMSDVDPCTPGKSQTL